MPHQGNATERKPGILDAQHIQCEPTNQPVNHPNALLRLQDLDVVAVGILDEDVT